MLTLISLPPQMAERLRRAQPVSVTNHVKARQSLIERAVTWLATECGWARRKRSAICSGKLCAEASLFSSSAAPVVGRPVQLSEWIVRIFVSLSHQWIETRWHKEPLCKNTFDTLRDELVVHSTVVHCDLSTWQIDKWYHSDRLNSSFQKPHA